jgi:NADH-quinone oxidoreductase subunit N
VLIAVVAGTTRGVTAALVYMMVYAFMQLGAFAVVVMLRRRDVIGDRVEDLAGLSATHPASALAMLIFMLSLGGIPPTAGFMGKFWVFGAAIESGYIWLALIGVLNSAISLYYYVRVVVSMYVAAPDDAPVPFQLSRGIVAVLVLMVACTVAFGVYPQALFEFAEMSAASLGAVSSSGLGLLSR